MKLKMNIYFRIFMIILLLVAFYFMHINNTNKWLVDLGYLIFSVALITPTYIFWKQKQKGN
jgi:uncharacterized membrane protein YhhN